MSKQKAEDQKFWLFARPPPLFCPALPSPLFCRAVTPIPLCSSHSLSPEHKRVDTLLLFKSKSSTVASQLTHGRNIPTDLTRRLPLFHIPCGWQHEHQLHKGLQDTILVVYFFPFKSELSSSMQPLRGRTAAFPRWRLRSCSALCAHTFHFVRVGTNTGSNKLNTKGARGQDLKKKKGFLFGGDTNCTACVTNWPDSLQSCSALSAPKDSTFEESFPIQKAAAHGRGQHKGNKDI